MKYGWPVIAVFLALSYLLVRVKMPTGDLALLHHWFTGTGLLGATVFTIAYAVAVVALVPVSFLTVLAGVWFGAFTGLVIVSIASTVGACVAFVIARRLMRDTFARTVERVELCRRIDALTARHAALAVAIARLTPFFPFNLANYGFGLTRTAFWTFAFWTWLCMLPSTLVDVGGASTLFRVLNGGGTSWVWPVAVVVTWAGLFGVKRFIVHNGVVGTGLSTDNP